MSDPRGLADAVASQAGGLASASMVERVARAICRAWFYCDLNTPDGAAHWLREQNRCRAEARAAISAMREPTEAMLRAHYEAVHPPTDSPAGGFTRWATWDEAKDLRTHDLRKSIAAMIDEALK